MGINSKLKILILSCGTGEGHNSAAQALKSKFDEKNIACEIKDVLTFKSEKTSKRIAGAYATVIKRVPKLFGLVYSLGKFYDNLRLPSPVYRANSQYAESLYKYIKENGFNRIVCTHLFAMQAVTAVRREYSFSVPSYGVMTDYTMHPFIKDSELDGYFVPNGIVAEQFLKKGFSKDKIIISGIPVHQKFRCGHSQQELRKQLNLPADKSIIAVMCGGAGCGKIKTLCKKLDKVLNGGHLVIVFAGRNEKLKASLDKKFAGNKKFLNMPFTEDINLYLKAADIAVSKAGGLSSTEIAVANVPLVHLKAVPGLETANMKYFSENGLSLRADTVKKAVKQTVQLLSDEACGEAIVKIQKHFINADATDSITEIISEGTVNERNFMGIADSGRIYFGQPDVLQNDPEAVTA